MHSKKKINFAFWFLNIVMLLIGVAVLVVGNLPLVVLCYAVSLIGVFYGASKIINFLFLNFKHTIYRYDFSVGTVCILFSVYIMINSVASAEYLPYAALALTAFNFIVKFQNSIDLLRAKSKLSVLVLFFSALLVYLSYNLLQDIQGEVTVTVAYFGGYIVANAFVNLAVRMFLNAASNRANKRAQEAEIEAVQSGEEDTEFDTLEFDVAHALKEESASTAYILKPTEQELGGQNRPHLQKDGEEDESVEAYSEKAEDSVQSESGNAAVEQESDAQKDAQLVEMAHVEHDGTKADEKTQQQAELEAETKTDDAAEAEQDGEQTQAQHNSKKDVGGANVAHNITVAGESNSAQPVKKSTKSASTAKRADKQAQAPAQKAKQPRKKSTSAKKTSKSNDVKLEDAAKIVPENDENKSE